MKSSASEAGLAPEAKRNASPANGAGQAPEAEAEWHQEARDSGRQAQTVKSSASEAGQAPKAKQAKILANAARLAPEADKALTLTDLSEWARAGI